MDKTYFLEKNCLCEIFIKKARLVTTIPRYSHLDTRPTAAYRLSKDAHRKSAAFIDTKFFASRQGTTAKVETAHEINENSEKQRLCAFFQATFTRLPRISLLPRSSALKMLLNGEKNIFPK
jgi:hypothetical protein